MKDIYIITTVSKDTNSSYFRVEHEFKVGAENPGSFDFHKTIRSTSNPDSCVHICVRNVGLTQQEFKSWISNQFRDEKLVNPPLHLSLQMTIVENSSSGEVTITCKTKPDPQLGITEPTDSEVKVIYKDALTPIFWRDMTGDRITTRSLSAQWGKTKRLPHYRQIITLIIHWKPFAPPVELQHKLMPEIQQYAKEVIERSPMLKTLVNLKLDELHPLKGVDGDRWYFLE